MKGVFPPYDAWVIEDATASTLMPAQAILSVPSNWASKTPAPSRSRFCWPCVQSRDREGAGLNCLCCHL